MPEPAESIAAGRNRKLADGTTIPVIGLGVWQVPDGAVCEDAVFWALEAGYRHIDTAQAYGNEASVGRALKRSGIAREEIFVTTKFFPRRDEPVAAAEKSLQRLGVDYVDLYLVHWPEGGPIWAWPGMQLAKERGYTRSIGVSNFSVSELQEVLALDGDPPVVNQIQFSPFEFRRALQSESEKQNVAIEAYSPLGTGRHLHHPAVADVAERLGRTPAQILLRWCLQHETIVLPKSTHQDRILENFQVFDFAIPQADMALLDALDASGADGQARLDKWW